jgi:predicted AAA+ superfamily ATPase
LYFYRDSNKKEIDFILEKNMTLYPIEVKKTTSPLGTDCANFSIIENQGRQTGKGAVICLCQEIMPVPKKNAVTVPVWEI